MVYDFADITKPKAAAQYMWDQETPGGIPYHTVLPLIGTPAFPKHGNYVIGVAETIQADCREPVRFPRILDISNPNNPQDHRVLPPPDAAEGGAVRRFLPGARPLRHAQLPVLGRARHRAPRDLHVRVGRRRRTRSTTCRIPRT